MHLRFQVEKMISDYQWIDNERKYFGNADTAYDFEANDMKEVSRRLTKLQETKDKLGKSVNMRAMNMLGKAEEKVSRILFTKYLIFHSLFEPHIWPCFALIKPFTKCYLDGK